MNMCVNVCLGAFLQATKIIYAIAWTHVGEELAGPAASGAFSGEEADSVLRWTYEGGVARVEHLVGTKGGRAASPDPTPPSPYDLWVGVVPISSNLMWLACGRLASLYQYSTLLSLPRRWTGFQMIYI